MAPRRVIRFLAGLILSCATAFTQVPSDAEIRKILADRVGAENLGSAIVVGVVDANARRVVAYGSLAKNDTRKLDGDTVFEIGSMSKVFTSLVLMDMVRKGEVQLTDPVSKYLPATVKVPERNNRKITLADLSTQSSGLPRMPNNFTPKDPDNPYADYSVQQMYDFLSGYTLTRDIGSQYEYSNLGVGLLGHTLTLRAATSYEALVRSSIITPLGMTSTAVTLTPDMKARLAVGHNETLAPVSNWDIPTLAGAGALRSTANDILTFLAANLGFVKSPLAQAMADEVSIRRPAGPEMEIAYAWHIQTKDGNLIIWHNGGTGGYRTYMGYDPKAKVGVVVLSNVSTPAGPDDIGRHLLNASYPLLKVTPPTEHKEITLDTKTFDRYLGVFQLAPNAVITMSRDGNKFYTQLTGQPKIEVFAEGDRKFFLKVVDAQLLFDVDPQGTATQVTLHQNGRDQVAKRIDEAEAKRAADELAKRVKDQTQSPGTEAALKRSIEELRSGEPKYDLMSPQFAAVTRQQLPQLKATITGFGALQSVTFKSIAPNGADVYEVKFENGNTEWRIMLDADGKTQGIGFRPLQDPNMRLILLLVCGLAFGQTPENLTFEVASVRPTPPPEPNARVFFGPPRGGPGTNDPGQITWSNAALRNILMTAYDVQTFLITAPDWLATERYDIVARVPVGATKQQVNVMWQNLLKERFGLVLHHESKEFQVEGMTVAKDGLKMKETDLGPNPDPFTPVAGPRKLDGNGMPQMNGYGAIVTIFPDGPRAQMAAKGLTLADFAARVGQQIRRPVVDKTGLTGRYDFMLEYTPDLSGFPITPTGDFVADPGTTIAVALEKQLGLKLTGSKDKLDVIVVDRANKIPTEN